MKIPIDEHIHTSFLNGSGIGIGRDVNISTEGKGVDI
jgi:hypothetical protein